MCARITKHVLLGIASIVPCIARACEEHVSTDPANNASWPTLSTNTSITSIDGALALGSLLTLNFNDPAIDNWKTNTTGARGQSPAGTINSYVSNITADVAQIAFTSTNVYVRASGVPSHLVGPFPDGNPSVPSDRNRTFRIPRTPVEQVGTKTNTGLGAIGVMVNGVPFYNALDARSYNNQNIWHQNANVAEAAGFDTGPGHPSPIMGTTNPVQGAYHYHQSPTTLLNQIDPGNTGQAHSPILGFALDGFPVYGPYGYANPNGTGGIERVESSYIYRSITTRTTLPNGTVLAPAQYGPAVGGAFPLGYYIEDFIFAAGSGDLDQYNGRFAVTPEYPNGTYAYFATLNANGSALYPYVIGPQYYGVVAGDNLSGNITIPANATLAFLVPEPATCALLMPLLFTLGRFRKSCPN